MKKACALLALLNACTPAAAPPAPVQTATLMEPTQCSMSLTPLLRSAECLDAAVKCMTEARTGSLHDPLDKFTREQEELILQRTCLHQAIECRESAWER